MKTVLLLMALLGVFVRGAGAKPERVVSVNLCSDELVVRLADAERVAGITKFSSEGYDSPVSAKAAGFHGIRGGAEEVLALRPDLVFAGPFNRRETVSILKRSGIPVVMLPVPADFGQIRANIRSAAASLGETGRGEAMIRRMDARLFRVAVSEGPRPTALFYRNRGFSAGCGTFENAILEAAGLENLSARGGTCGHVQISLEKLILLKPDYIVLAHEPGNHFTLGREILNHPAIRRGLAQTQILTLPAGLLNCGSPESAVAVEMLAGQIRNSGGGRKAAPDKP